MPEAEQKEKSFTQDMYDYYLMRCRQEEAQDRVSITIDRTVFERFLKSVKV